MGKYTDLLEGKTSPDQEAAPPPEPHAEPKVEESADSMKPYEAIKECFSLMADAHERAQNPYIKRALSGYLARDPQVRKVEEAITAQNLKFLLEGTEEEKEAIMGRIKEAVEYLKKLFGAKLKSLILT